MPASTTMAAQATTGLPPLEATPVDQFFVALGKADQQLWLAYSSLRPRHLGANANGDDFSGSL
jgi:hypothetical protein